MIDRKKKAMDMFGAVEWVTYDRGFITCPGINLHTSKNGKKDCRIITTGAPTIFCLHTTCSSVIEDSNLKFRRACGSGEKVEGRIFTFEEKQKMREAFVKKKMEFDLQSMGALSQATVFSSFAWEPADMWEDSPERLIDDPKEDWRLFLNIFNDEDVLWNGQAKDSGETWHTKNFLTVREWKEKGPKGNFTCPSTFKPGTFSRCNEDVLSRKFLVIESDIFSQKDICAVFNFCRKFMKLRAVVNTGGKSLHGWFDFPSVQVFDVLKQMFPSLGCDKALFTSSQPVRMPGVMRGKKIQSLLYLNL